MSQLIQVSLAYKLLALQLMVGEANFFVGKLELPCDPIQPQNVVEVYASPPGIGELGITGSIATTNYLFTFLRSHLSGVAQNNGGDWFLSQYPVWAMAPSLIETNEAYQMATQWLSSVSVDVPKLEAAYNVRVSQLEIERSTLPKRVRRRTESRNKSVLPVYYVKWGVGQFRMFGNQSSPDPAVAVTILGHTKELYELRINDGSVLKRPLLNVPHGEEIADLPDAPLHDLLPELRAGRDFTEIMRVPEGYRSAVRDDMLQEINRLASGLNLRGGNRVSISNIVDYYVWPPLFGLGGNVITTNYNFRFNERRKLHEIKWRFPPAGGNPDFTFLVDTNRAYELSTKWLSSLGVDVKALESSNRPMVVQARPETHKGPQRAWLFATWGTNYPPAVQVVVDGSNGELCGIHFNEEEWLDGDQKQESVER